MTPSPRSSAARLFTALGLAAVAAAACTDRTGPLEPGQTPGGGPGTGGKPPSVTLTLDCRADIRARSVTCAAPAPRTGGASADLIYGGQNKYVLLTSSSVDYDSTTHKFKFNVSLRNLLRQAIGTTNGTTADPSGVKVFFRQQPVATAGTGTITVENINGTGDFTEANQPYYSYVQLLAPFATSANKAWQFDVPPTVISADFKVAISAPVQFPNGWIEISHPVWSIRRTTSKLLTAKVFSPLGEEIEAPAEVTWSVSNPALASVPADSGLVEGLLPGTVTVTASSTNRVAYANGDTATFTQTGTAQLTVTGKMLTWTQAGGNNDWNNALNWSPSVTPVAQDSVTIPVVVSGIYPVLTDDEQIDAVTVANTASIQLTIHDLTATGDVLSAPSSGGITSSTGRLFLSGIGSRNLSGIVPKLRVTSGANYSLAGNVLTVAPLRIEAGRLRNTAFRIRVNNQ